jgi:hypothetical protein
MELPRCSMSKIEILDPNRVRENIVMELPYRPKLLRARELPSVKKSRTEIDEPYLARE